MVKDSKKNLAKDNKEEVLNAALKKFCFLFPENEKGIEQFEQVFGNTEIELPEDLADGKLFLERLKSSRKIVPSLAQNSQTPVKCIPISGVKTKLADTGTVKKKNDYFKKIVLAAEIASSLHDEPTFGHVKFVKVQYLCEQVCHMELSTSYGKYAAGPLDPKLMYSIDGEFKKRKWFKVIKSAKGTKYELDEKVQEYKQYYLNYYKKEITQIEHLIDLFRKKRSDFCEIVATLFYVWNEINTQSLAISNELLIERFYAWNSSKLKFSRPSIIEGITWMKENNIVPAL